MRPKGKNRGKYIGKGKDHVRSVNAYSSDIYFAAGLEVLEAHSSSTSPPVPGTGMIDCGATASAAPEAVLKGLIDAILTHDKGARIELDQSARPYFRFGNGRWGRILCRIHISSSISGRTKQFALYTLPNPPEYISSGFDKSSLVPLLVEMNHLGVKEVGMLIDFSIDLAMNTLEESPEIYQLEKNTKGHFSLDIVKYLTQGHPNLEGQPHILVRTATTSSNLQPEHQYLELGTIYMDMTLQDRDLDQQLLQVARDRMLRVYQHAQQLRSSVVLIAQMPVAPEDNSSTSTTSPTASLGHVALPAADIRAEHRQRDQEEDSSQAQGEAPRFSEEDSHGQARPPIQCGSMALPGQARGRSSDEQCSRQLGSLRMLQSSLGVCSSSGERCCHSEVRVSGHIQADVGRTISSDGRPATYAGHLPRHDGEDQCRGETPDPHPRPQDEGNDDNDRLSGYDQQSWKPRRVVNFVDPNEVRERPGGSVRAGGLRVKEQSSTTALPIHMGKKIMAMVALLSSFTSLLLMSLHLGPRDGLWEVACAPHSWLSMAAEEHGLQPRRISLEQGFDLYRAETWEYLKTFRRQHRPLRIWFSLPCTKWCPWTSLNFSTPDRQRQLETARRRDRRLL